jgi:hypothetical protein
MRQPEIGESQASIVTHSQENVRGLDVAMNQGPSVGVSQGVQDSPQQPLDFGPAQTLATCGQGATEGTFHDQIRGPDSEATRAGFGVLLVQEAKVEDTNYVRMGEASYRPGFSSEGSTQFGNAAAPGLKELDRNGKFEVAVGARPHLGHAPGRERLDKSEGAEGEVGQRGLRSRASGSPQPT